MGGSGADRVYASDLEKAVQYSLTNEILTHVRTFKTVFQKRFFFSPKIQSKVPLNVSSQKME